MPVLTQTANDPFSFIKPEPIRDRKPQRRKPTRVTLISVGVAILVLLVLGVGLPRYLHLDSDVQTNTLFPQSNTQDVGLQKLGVFIYDQLSIPIHLVSVEQPCPRKLTLLTFELHNSSQSSVDLNTIVYHDTYEPRIQRDPGGTWRVGWPKHSICSAFSFEHTIEYIEVHTNKGTFRFDPSGFLISQSSRQPRADLKRLTQLEDAKIDEQEQAIISARKELLEKHDTTNPLLKRYAHSFEMWAGQPVDFVKAAREFRERVDQNRARNGQQPLDGPAGQPVAPRLLNGGGGDDE